MRDQGIIIKGNLFDYSNVSYTDVVGYLEKTFEFTREEIKELKEYGDWHDIKVKLREKDIDFFCFN